MFKEGESGNPAGRPKTTEAFKKLLKDNSEEALKEIIKIMKKPFAEDKDKLAAAKYIVDKATGPNYKLFDDESEFEDTALTVRIVKAKPKKKEKE